MQRYARSFNPLPSQAAPARGPIGQNFPTVDLIVDQANVAKAAYHVVGDLRSQSGWATGMSYSLINSLRKLMWNFPTTRQVIYAAEKRPIWRSDYDPQYKMNRASWNGTMQITEDDTWGEQKELWQRFQEVLPVVVAQCPGTEADDLAYILSSVKLRNYNRAPLTILVSNDKDWFQLVCDDVFLWRPMTNKLVTPSNFSEITQGFDNPEQYLEYKILAGDDKDNVPGIKGVGPKTALRFFHDSNMKGKAADKIREFRSSARYKLNRTMLDLSRIPDEYPPRTMLDFRDFKSQEFQKLCVSMDFMSILEKWGNTKTLMEDLMFARDKK